MDLDPRCTRVGVLFNHGSSASTKQVRGSTGTVDVRSSHKTKGEEAKMGRCNVILWCAVFVLSNVGVAVACNGKQLEADLDWCIRDRGANFETPGADEWSNIMEGACNKDADLLRDNFRDCQQDENVRENYDSCTAGQQIDTARALMQKWGYYPQCFK